MLRNIDPKTQSVGRNLGNLDPTVGIRRRQEESLISRQEIK